MPTSTIAPAKLAKAKSTKSPKVEAVEIVATAAEYRQTVEALAQSLHTRTTAKGKTINYAILRKDGIVSLLSRPIGKSGTVGQGLACVHVASSNGLPERFLQGQTLLLALQGVKIFRGEYQLPRSLRGLIIEALKAFGNQIDPLEA